MKITLKNNCNHTSNEDLKTAKILSLFLFYFLGLKDLFARSIYDLRVLFIICLCLCQLFKIIQSITC